MREGKRSWALAGYLAVALLAVTAFGGGQPPAPSAKPVEATVTTSSKKLGPVACAAVRMHLRQEFRKKGMSIIESIRAANQATDDVVNGLVPDAETLSGKTFGAIGDGTILQAILDFFKSPQGQALLDALVKLLLGLLADVGPSVVDHGTVFTLDLPPPGAVGFG